MKKRVKAVFLDRDGTINVEKHYLHKIEDFEFLHGAVEGLKLLQNAEYKLIIITNQSGIGRGYYTENDFNNLNVWMLDELKKQGVVIDAVYYCPHLPHAKIEKYKVICDCRKPAIGLYERAIKEFDIEIDHSWAIGDKIRDCSICKQTECRGFLIGSNEENEIIEAVKNGGDEVYKNIKYADDLLTAAREIVEMDG